MAKVSETILPGIIQIDPGSEIPLYQQIYACLQEAIEAHQLKSGVRLPSIRDLAEMLHVSRNTITNAFDQLIAEGYLEARSGSGTYVTGELNTVTPHLLDRHRPDREDPANSVRPLSRSGSFLPDQLPRLVSGFKKDVAFRYGLPALDHFPVDIWTKLTDQQYQFNLAAMVPYTHSELGGYQPFRELVADYLRNSRGLRCTTEQVMIISGTQQGLYVALQLLANPGDQILVQDPTYFESRETLTNIGLDLIPISLQSEHETLTYVAEKYPGARISYVNPYRYHPLNQTMSMARRNELLDWSDKVGGWIIEQDFDTEFFYDGAPLPPLQGLDPYQRVIHIGTFNRLLFPTLGLGYMVVPSDLVNKTVNLSLLTNMFYPSFNQFVFADFIEQGHLARHIRRMRKLYRYRRDLFLDIAQKELGNWLEFECPDAGTSITGWLHNNVASDVDICRIARDAGVIVFPTSSCYLIQPAPQGIVFGYTACDGDTILNGVHQMRKVLESFG